MCVVLSVLLVNLCTGPLKGIFTCEPFVGYHLESVEHHFK